MADRSRLTRTQARQTKKQIIVFSIAIVITLFVFINFGPTVLTAVGGILSGKKNTFTLPSSKNVLDAPSINQPFTATDSAKIKISGKTSYKEAEVELFVNDSSENMVSVRDDGSFVFDNVPLQQGDNILKVRVTKGKDLSDFSSDYLIKLLKSGAPKLDVSFPQDNATLQKGDQEINVTGTTDSENSVTVNGFVAIVDSSGNFSYYLKLNEGDNSINIVAQNPAGRSTTKTLKVTFKP